MIVDFNDHEHIEGQFLLGNVSKETETYYEVKFKKAIKLAEMKEINFDELKNLIFQEK